MASTPLGRVRLGAPYDAAMYPDDATAARAVAGPLRLAPFAATRLSAARVGDPASARLLARPHRAVPERIRRWRRLGNLVQDRQSAIYVHEYTSQGLTVRAVVALAAISPTTTDTRAACILPHEDVAPQQADDLAARMRAMRVNPAPIQLLHHGSQTTRTLVRGVVDQVPTTDFVDRAGQRHRLWAVTDLGLIRAFAEAYADQRLVVADGHHRLAAYQRNHAAQGDPNWTHGLAMIVDHGETPLFLGAIHRVLRGPTIAEVCSAVEISGAGFLRPLDPAEQLHALHPRTMVLTDADTSYALDLDANDPRAAVEVLHDSVLSRLDARWEYHHTADAALQRLRSPARAGEPRVVVLLPAIRYDELVAILDTGRRLPQKATSFQPKPSIGAVMRVF